MYVLPFRDELPEEILPGLKFGGNGYVIMARGRFSAAGASAVRFKFKTFSPDGLMFLMGKDRDYLSIEMQDGKVVARYDLGSGPAVLDSAQNQNTPQRYNDGKWHSLYLNRVRNDGILKIDDQTSTRHTSLFSFVTHV